QEAAEITEVVDPMWCPEGVSPGGAGCTTNFPSISDLLNDMVTNTASYTQNGVIYFTVNPGTGVFELSPTTLPGGDFDTLKPYNLTLQGGWNGSSVSPAFAGQTNFGSNPIIIGTSTNPWVGSVTLEDIAFNGVSTANALTVYTTTGNIALDNVDVTNQAGGNYTALLDSDDGNITVQNGSRFDGDNTTSQGFSATTNTGEITITGAVGPTNNVTQNFIWFVQSGGAGGNGATLSAPVISLSYVLADNNDGNGLVISNASLAELYAIAAIRNGENGIFFSNSELINMTEVYAGYQNGTQDQGNGLSGMLINGTGSTIANMNGGALQNNGRYGIEIYNGNLFIQAPPLCPTTGPTINTLGCYNVTPSTDTTVPVITPSVSGTMGANGWYIGNVSVTWSVSDPESGIFSSSGCTPSTLSTDTAGVTLTCSATNGVGLSNSASATVKIDQTGPTITYTSRTVPSGSWTNTDVTVNWSCTDTTSGPVAASVSQTVMTEGAGQSATGVCTDNAGNTASDTQGGINIDKTAPSLNLPADITAEATSASGAVVGYSASATDNLDGTVSANCSPASGFTFPLGTTPVSCSAIDAAGNMTADSFQVTVQDTTPPTLSLPGTINATTSTTSAVVTYSASATDAVDGSVAVNCSPASGSAFPLGPTTVNCSATDAQSNTSNGSFIVNVQNTEGPTITVPADITVEATSASGASVSYSASATDLVDGSVSVNCTPASGSTFPLGTTSVTCSATDSDSYTSTAGFQVTVEDTTAPSISSVADITVTSSSAAGMVVNYTSPSASDVVDGPAPVNCSPVSGSTFPLGTTIVTCTATDSATNTAFSTFNVQVNLASTPSTPGSSNSSSNSKPNKPVVNIPVTGGGVVNLKCNSVFTVFGVKLSFQNLCDGQAKLTHVSTNNMPGVLPDGFSFVMGLDVDILIKNQIIENLPDGTSIQMDFPILGGSSDQFAVLHWNGSQWVEVSPQTGDAQSFYQILTTDETGIFVLVKK
ncbi:MAG TPA: HYR domain-containing protein, partial [Anaerolineales bacterium]|nr:HYR domain-containing protein [Anaerolineales bacterium]